MIPMKVVAGPDAGWDVIKSFLAKSSPVRRFELDAIVRSLLEPNKGEPGEDFPPRTAFNFCKHVPNGVTRRNCRASY